MNTAAVKTHTDQIKDQAYSISAIVQVMEILRAHATEEIPLDAAGINNLAQNGYILGGLATAVEMLANSICFHTGTIEDIAEDSN